MHPLLNHWRGLAAYLLAWALAGPLLAALLQGLGVAPFLRALPWAVPLCAVFAFVALATYYPCRARPFPARRSLPAAAPPIRASPAPPWIPPPNSF